MERRDDDKDGNSHKMGREKEKRNVNDPETLKF